MAIFAEIKKYMYRRAVVLIIMLLPLGINAQTKKAKAPVVKKVVAESIIRTQNKDSLYYDLFNTIMITPQKGDKTDYKVVASSGTLEKYGANFYQLTDIKGKSVTVQVFNAATNKLVETKTFYMAKANLPF